jgi:hypothetical protein
LKTRCFDSEQPTLPRQRVFSRYREEQIADTGAKWMFRQLKRDQPLIRAERSYLGRLFAGKGRLFQALITALTMMVSAVPFLISPNHTNGELYLALLITLFIFSLLSEVQVLHLTFYAVWHGKDTTAWDTLILTGVDARRIVRSKWRGVYRHSWQLMILLILLRFATAWGMMQYLIIFPKVIWFAERSRQLVTLPFHYHSYYYNLTTITTWLPDLWKILLSLGILIIYIWFEYRLITAVGIMTALISAQQFVFFLILGLISRILIVVAALVIFGLIGYSGETITGNLINNMRDRSELKALHDRIFCPDLDLTQYYCGWYPTLELPKRRAFETIQVALSSVSDAGIMLTANILRPIGSPQFVFRNCVSALLGFALYAWLIRFFLRLAEKAAVRWGALPPLDNVPAEIQSPSANR